MRKYKFNYSNLLTYLFSIIIFCGMITYSMVPLSSLFVQVRYALIIVLFVLAVATQKHSIKQWIYFLIGSSITMISVVVTQIGLEYFFMILAIFSISTISPKKIMKFSAIMIVITLIFLTISSWLRVIPNLIFYRDNIIRQSWGTIYPLILAGYIFYANAAWISSKQNDKKKYMGEVLLILISAVLVFRVTGARNDTFAIILLLGSYLINMISDRYNKAILTSGIVIIFAILFLSIFITQLLPYYSNSFNWVNNLFNHRLGLQYTLFEYYAPKLFGQDIPQVGAGGSTNNAGYYFYIDNSYTRLLFMYGIVFTIFILIMLLNYLRNLMEIKAYSLVYILLIVIASGIAEDAFINPVINVFLYLLLENRDLLLQDFGNRSEGF